MDPIRRSLIACLLLLPLVMVGTSRAYTTCIDNLSADANGDCAVDPLDSGFVLARFGCSVGTGDTGCDSADVNGDGSVDPLDNGFVLARFCSVGSPFPVVSVDEADSPTTETVVTITGNTAGATSIEIAGGLDPVSAAVVDCIFAVEVELHPNSVNHLFVTGIADDGTPGAPAPVTITHDAQPPSLFIDFPTDGAELTTETTDVAGRVSDMLSGFLGLTVTVNGIDAEVDVGIGTNGTFFAAGVPLALGENTLTAVATDLLGNTTETQITVNRVEIPEDAPRLTLISGNQQTSQMRTLLPEPIVVQVTLGDGTPFANKLVTFDVIRSDGRLTEDGSGDGALLLQVFTDVDGLAEASWRLGADAGCGNNRVEVTSPGILGTTFFCASATPAPAGQINIGTGNNQRVEIGSPAPGRLRAWVSDACNGVSDIGVTFTVTVGGGTVDGQSEVTVLTGDTGHAEVDFVLGLDVGNNAVEATFPTNPGLPARFLAVGVVRNEGQPTGFSGLVLNNSEQPIQGATCTLTVGGSSLPTIQTDIDGMFLFGEVPASGLADLVVDGQTAFHVGGTGGRDIPTGSFPTLHYEPVLIPNALNSLGTPILLPALNPTNAVLFDNTQDVELTVEGIEGLRMTVKAGSVTLADGSVPSPENPATLSVNQVRYEDVPMPMPDGAAPPFAWTLQPGGAMFDPPVEIIYPNIGGLAAGSIAYFLSFNHDTMNFEIIASGSVTDDGQCIVSDPGVGIIVSGWGCNCPPYSVTGECCKCDGPCQECQSGECVTCPGGGSCCNGVCCGPDALCCESGCCDAGTCCGPSCCDADEQCCGDTCCASDESCCADDVCCLPDESCCDGECCGPDNECCIDGCCDNFCCDAAGECCLEQCCGDTCCPSGDQCCGENGDVCCPGEVASCCGILCCAEPFTCCGNGEDCCFEGTECCGDICCDTGACCGDGCCPADTHCCLSGDGSSICCASDFTCCEDECCGPETECCGSSGCCEDCCGGNECCSVDQECCGDFCCSGTCCGANACCAPGQLCCGESCCGGNQFCCNGNECCDVGTACCASGCCQPGEQCVAGQCVP